MSLKSLQKDGLTGVELFQLYDTFGFPLELSTEEAIRREIPLSKNGRKNLMLLKSNANARDVGKGKFKGGLEGQTLEHRKLHTATHLMNAELHNMFEGQISQKGSNINTERLLRLYF